MDSTAPENVLSPLDFDANEASHAEPMNVDSELVLVPMRDPPSKVKMLEVLCATDEETAGRDGGQGHSFACGTGMPSGPMCCEQHAGVVGVLWAALLRPSGNVSKERPQRLFIRCKSLYAKSPPDHRCAAHTVWFLWVKVGCDTRTSTSRPQWHQATYDGTDLCTRTTYLQVVRRFGGVRCTRLSTGADSVRSVILVRTMIAQSDSG